MKVIKYLVDYVTQFPSDTECTRYITTISDKVYSLIKCSGNVQYLSVIVLSSVF